MGQRSTSQLRLLDFAMAITFYIIIAFPYLMKVRYEGFHDYHNRFSFFYLIGVFLSPKWLTFRHFIDAPPILK